MINEKPKLNNKLSQDLKKVSRPTAVSDSFILKFQNCREKRKAREGETMQESEDGREEERERVASHSQGKKERGRVESSTHHPPIHGKGL